MHLPWVVRSNTLKAATAAAAPRLALKASLAGLAHREFGHIAQPLHTGWVVDTKSLPSTLHVGELVILTRRMRRTQLHILGRHTAQVSLCVHLEGLEKGYRRRPGAQQDFPLDTPSLWRDNQVLAVPTGPGEKLKPALGLLLYDDSGFSMNSKLSFF